MSISWLGLAGDHGQPRLPDRDELLEQRIRHGLDGLIAIDGDEDPGATVVVDDVVQGRQLPLEAGRDDVRLVVVALVERRTVLVADAGHGRRVEDLVVRVAVGAADPAARQPAQEHLRRDLDVRREHDRATFRGERPIERLGLRRVSRKAVEDRAGDRIGLLQPLHDHADRDVIRHERTAIHERLRLATERRIRLDRIAEQVAGRNMGKPEPLRQQRRLRPLPRPRSPSSSR